ncbi:Zinc finger protein-like 1 [Intoshia linei]|uniref:Zinc finger protein-like 1 n=1 Tax=Intoshia linei TaxID=1819745 RepID=A0A177B8N5_9BILA|nr:Zinc finger protein-like 1 [Intoshia linei]
MGLCSCPKRKPTPMFCFIHRVNVCDYCILSDHNACIVKSYTNWLDDPEYDATCRFCQQELIKDDERNIRLLCYDVFHWNCLEMYASKPDVNLPMCPTCGDLVIRHGKMGGPVADALESRFKSSSWFSKYNPENLNCRDQSIPKSTNDFSVDFSNRESTHYEKSHTRQAITHLINDWQDKTIPIFEKWSIRKRIYYLRYTIKNFIKSKRMRCLRFFMILLIFFAFIYIFFNMESNSVTESKVIPTPNVHETT